MSQPNPLQTTLSNGISSAAAGTHRAQQPEPDREEGVMDPMARWPRAILGIGLGIFVLNMALAWWMAIDTNHYIQKPLLGSGESGLVLNEMKVADLGQSMIYRRIIEGNVHMKVISNKQTIMIVGMAAGFGFLAVGFSLVIMAIRGAFQLGAKLPNKAGELVLRSASPGVLCFALGAVVIIVALVQETTLEFGGMDLKRTRTTEGQDPGQQAHVGRGEGAQIEQRAAPIAVPERLNFDDVVTSGAAQ